MMTIVGLGCDLLRIERIAKLGARHGKLLLDRVLAATERDALGKRVSDWPGCAAHVAGLIASKEAFFKALGTGLLMPLRWVDVAVDGTRDRPAIALQGTAAIAFANLGGLVCQLALSGNHAFVHATVILLGRPPSPADRQPAITQRLTTGDHCA